MRKYLASHPPNPPLNSSTKSNSSQSPQQNSYLENAIQSKIFRFKATHLLVGRLKSLSNNDLITDLDLLTSTLGLQYQREEFCASFDGNVFQLFTHHDPVCYHCLLTLTTPVNVTSAPDGFNSEDKALPIFSFSYKANPPHYLNGTS